MEDWGKFFDALVEHRLPGRRTWHESRRKAHEARGMGVLSHASSHLHYYLFLVAVGLSGALSSSAVLFSSPHARAPTFNAIGLALHTVADTGGRVIAAPRGPTGASPRRWLVVWT